MAAKSDREATLAVAHLNAWLGRVKKFPTLDKLLGRSKEPKRATKAKPWQAQLKGWERALSRK